jgi:nucleotide-binding universal stress UspA family protein
MNASSAAERPDDFCLVAGFAFNEAGADAFDCAAEMGWRAPGGALHLIHVLARPQRGAYMRELAAHLHLYAEEKLKYLGAAPGFDVGVHVRSGRPVEEIARLARELGADLIVVGSDRGALKSLVAEPAFQRLLPIAPCPVVVAGPKPDPQQALEHVVEPPCLDCVRSRLDSSGATWWCARHAVHALRAHTFSYHRELSLRSHDSAVTPTGIDMA